MDFGPVANVLKDHRLTSKRGVHLFRYFLFLMRTPHIVTKNLIPIAYMHEQVTKEFV